MNTVIIFHAWIFARNMQHTVVIQNFNTRRLSDLSANVHLELVIIERHTAIKNSKNQLHLNDFLFSVRVPIYYDKPPIQKKRGFADLTYLIGSLKLFCWCNHHISILNCTMISLDIQRTWLAFVAIQCTTRNSWNFLICNYRFTIGHNCNHPTY